MKLEYDKYRKRWLVIITHGPFEEIVFESKEKIFCQAYKIQCEKQRGKK